MHVSPKHFYCSHISSHLYSEVKYFKIQCVYMCICLLVYVDAFIMFSYVCALVCIHIFAKGVAVSPAFSPARSAAPHTGWCGGRGMSCP